MSQAPKIQIQDILDRLESKREANAPKFVRIIEAAAERILERARAQWPVKSGASKAGLRIEVGINGEVLHARIINDVPYVKYIKGRVIEYRSPWPLLVASPARAVQPDLALEVLKEFEKVLNG